MFLEPSIHNIFT